MFESCRAFTLTDWAVKRSGTIHYHEVSCVSCLSPLEGFLSSPELSADSLICFLPFTAQDVGSSRE